MSEESEMSRPSERAMAAATALDEGKCPHISYSGVSGRTTVRPRRTQCDICLALALDAFAEEAVGNLLARIHGDGGHYMAEHGYEKALEDADAVVVAYQQQVRGTEAAVEEARREEREACAKVAENAIDTTNVPAHLRGGILTAIGVLIAAAIRSRSSRPSEAPCFYCAEKYPRVAGKHFVEGKWTTPCTDWAPSPEAGAGGEEEE